MDHIHIVTAKVRTRHQFPRQSLREYQMLENIYGITPAAYDLEEFLAHNTIDSDKFVFPSEVSSNIKK